MTETRKPTEASSGQDDKGDAGVTPRVTPEQGRARPRPPIAWLRSGAGYDATIDGRVYRVTKYPADSPMGAPYGAYAEGRFIGSGLTLDNVKNRCAAHAARVRARTPLPEAE